MHGTRTRRRERAEDALDARVNVRMTQAEVDLVERLAVAERRSISAFGRELILRGIASPDKEAMTDARH